MTKINKSGQKRSPVAGKDLRDQTVIAKAMAGKKTQEIADEMGMARQTVSTILNSTEVQAKVKEIDNMLATGIDDAIKTVLKHVKYDYTAAKELLKNYGSMKQTLDLKHSFPKATVIERRDGTQVILGTEEDLDE